jgi:glutathione S-transferase
VGDLVLHDSTIILEYLEDRWPTPPLYPTDVTERARCRQLEAAADEILFPVVFELVTEVFYKPRGEGDEARIARACAAIVAHYDGLERRLGDRPFLCGAFSVADIGYFLTVTFAANLGAMLGDAHPRLRAWYERALARPSVAAEMAGLLAAQQRLAAA